MNSRELLELFKTLDAPSLEDMHGEYAATLLRLPNAFVNFFGQAGVGNPLFPGKWLNKAFRPVSATEGRGYNTFLQFGRKVRRYPMFTVVAPSRYDGKPAYQLVYRAYRSMFGDIHMVDEIRRVAPGLYLGIGTMGFTPSQRMIPLPFMLKGPENDYVADIGTARIGFDIKTEIPALER